MLFMLLLYMLNFMSIEYYLLYNGQNGLIPFSPKLYSLIPHSQTKKRKCPFFVIRFSQNRVKKKILEPYSDVFKDL